MHPFISFFGITIPSYGLCMLIAFAGAITYTTLRSRKRSFTFDDVLLIGAFVLLFAIVGGGGLYIAVTYSPSEILESVKKLDFSFLTSGGIVFYGGLIGGVIGAFVGARLAKKDLFEIEDIIVPVLPLGHAIGRIGCLLAGCCHGMEYDGVCAVYYKNSITGLDPNVGYFPVQPLEALLDVFIAVYLFFYARKPRKKFYVMANYLLLYGVMRFCTELLRGDAIRGSLGALSTSQWISVFLIGANIAFLAVDKISEKKDI